MTFQDFTSLATVFGSLFVGIGLIVGAITFLLIYGEKNVSSPENVEKNLKTFALWDFIFGAIVFLGTYHNISARPFLSIGSVDIVNCIAGLIFWLAGLGFLLQKSWSRVLHYLLIGTTLLSFMLHNSVIPLATFFYTILLAKFLSNRKIKTLLR